MISRPVPGGRGAGRAAGWQATSPARPGRRLVGAVGRYDHGLERRRTDALDELLVRPARRREWGRQVVATAALCALLALGVLALAALVVV